MARDSLGIDVKRAFILLAATAAVLFAVISLMPGEPAAQTASSNGKIAYVGFDTETENQYVYTMNADGANLERLTNTPSSSEGEDTQATWAPDGSWLAFTSTRSEGPQVRALSPEFAR
jgi:TolB protein